MEQVSTTSDAVPDRRNEDWRFGRPHVWGRELFELSARATPLAASSDLIEYTDFTRYPCSGGVDTGSGDARVPVSVGTQALVQTVLQRVPQGRCFRIPDGERRDEPLVLRCEVEGVRVVHQHIVVGAGACAHITEEHHYCGEACLVNLRSYELLPGASLKLEQRELGNGASRAFCVSSFTCAAGARLCVLSTHSGHQWARHEVTTELTGEAGDALVLSANRLEGEQWLDMRMRQLHSVRGCKSRLLCKNVVEERATVIFGGNIRVQPCAQETDAYLTNLNLLMSPQCTIHSLPGLEILANRVRCSHGAASAPPDPEQLFYLQSRGLALPDAEELLAGAFLGDVRQKFENC